MQLKMKKTKNVSQLLKTATGCLLGATAMATAHAQSATEGWETDVAILYYSEPDRVTALEPAIAIKKTFDDESILGFKLVLDTLTGASHNGATASSQVQTFTRPSGNGTYSAANGETPLDDTFRDTRINFSANYEQPLDRLDKVIYGANISNEFDFFSVGGSVTFMRDINQRNTTLSAGISFELDSISAVGGFAEPLTQMQANTATQNKTQGSETRFIGEFLVGVTQIIDKNTLMQFNYGFALSDGYHNDPYKVISVVNSITGLPIENTNQNLSGTYFYENRPDTRNKQSLFAKVKRYLSGDVADISYRYMWDDWGVASSTIDAHYRYNINASWYLEPHVRYYDQQAADFYRHSITDTQVATIGPNLTADYRLGEMQATTIGVKLGFLTSDGKQSSVRLEYYQQTGNSSPSDAVGDQLTQDLYPDVDAVILQYNYRF